MQILISVNYFWRRKPINNTGKVKRNGALPFVWEIVPFSADQQELEQLVVAAARQRRPEVPGGGFDAGAQVVVVVHEHHRPVHADHPGDRKCRREQGANHGHGPAPVAVRQPAAEQLELRR